MQNKLEYLIYIFFSKVCCFLGLQKTRRFGLLLGSFFFHFLPIRKGVVLKNLKLAFPDMPESERKALALENYRALGVTFAEILVIPVLSPDDVIKALHVENIDFIKSKYEQGKGLILMTAHFGNWEYAALSVGLQMDDPLVIVTKNQRNPYVNAWMNNVRKKWGNKPAPLGVSIRNVFKELLEKKVVAMAADQRGPQEGIRVQLFGQSSAVFPGPAALAIKTGAPLLVGFPIRLPDMNYSFTLQEISKEGLPDNIDEAIQELSQRHTTLLEEYVRKYPGQWFWMHNRWKY
ncbi:MAG: lysophospholipid acyltransferase family protein [Ignavibacteriales bacterium]|nr:lysophospholipid acyltransferase family protein [Ignavibacteriales bacterium]